jgi:hypothetical protein
MDGMVDGWIARVHGGIFGAASHIAATLRKHKAVLAGAGKRDQKWHRHSVHSHGRAVQVDPIKPVLKAPGSILLKQRCDGPLSNVAFNSACAATARVLAARHGRAVQVEPMQPVLKTP